MKRYFALLLALSLLLSGCGAAPTETEPSTEATEPSSQVTEAPTEEITEAPTEASTEVPTEEPTEAPTEPAFFNPLTGEMLEAPVETRIVSISIGSTRDAMPSHGLSQADMIFEMFVNGYVTRLLAMYTDPSDVSAIGSIRSQRYHFTDISQSYDTIALSAGGSNSVLADVNRSGVDYINVDTASATTYSFRDTARNSSGIAWEHCLMVKGGGVYDRAAKLGYSTAMDPEKDYGMHFAEDKAMTEGQSAGTVTLTFRLDGAAKDSVFAFNSETGLYEFSQYGRAMVDGGNDQSIAFRNVFILQADTWTDGDGYQVSNILGSGNGYFACDGYMIPIQWHRQTDSDTFTFTLEDGTALQQGVGTSYIAIAPLSSTVTGE